MAKWRIYGLIGASKYLGEVEADTQEEALEKVDELYEESYISLCHQCSGEIDIGELYDYEAERVDG